MAARSLGSVRSSPALSFNEVAVASQPKLGTDGSPCAWSLTLLLHSGTPAWLFTLAPTAAAQAAPTAVAQAAQVPGAARAPVPLHLEIFCLDLSSFLIFLYTAVPHDLNSLRVCQLPSAHFQLLHVFVKN